MSIVKHFLFRRNDVSSALLSKNFSQISAPHIKCNHAFNFQQFRCSGISVSYDKSFQPSPEKRNAYDNNHKSLAWVKMSIMDSVNLKGYVTANLIGKIIRDLKRQKQITSDHATVILKSMNRLVLSDPVEKKKILDELSFKNIENFGNDMNKTEYFNQLIYNYSEHAQGIDSVEVLDEMKLANASPNAATFKNLIHSHCKNKELNEAVHITKYMASKDMRQSIFSNSLILYCNALLGKKEEAFDYILQCGLKNHPLSLGYLCLGFAESGNMEMLKDSLNSFSPTTPIYDLLASKILPAIIKQGNGHFLKEIEAFLPVIQVPNATFNLLENLSFNRNHLDVVRPYFQLSGIIDNDLAKIIAQKICKGNKSFDDVNAVVCMLKGQMSDVAVFKYEILRQLLLTENLECAKEMMVEMHRENITIKPHMIYPFLYAYPPPEFIKELKQVCAEMQVEYPEKGFVYRNFLRKNNSDLDKLACYLMNLSDNTEDIVLQSQAVDDILELVIMDKKYRLFSKELFFLENFILLSKNLKDCGYIHTGKKKAVPRILANILKFQTNIMPYVLHTYFLEINMFYLNKNFVEKMMNSILVIENVSRACTTVGIEFNKDAVYSELLTHAQNKLSTDDYDKFLQKVLSTPNLMLSDSCINLIIWHSILTGNEIQLKKLVIPANLPITYPVSHIPSHILKSKNPNTLIMLEDYLKRVYGESDTFWILFSSFLQNDMMKELADLNDRYKNIDKDNCKSIDYVYQCILSLRRSGMVIDKFDLLWSQCKDETDRLYLLSICVTEFCGDSEAVLKFLKYTSDLTQIPLFLLNKILGVFLENKVLPPESLGLSSNLKELFNLVIEDKLDADRFLEVVSTIGPDEKLKIPYNILTKFYYRVIENNEFDSAVVSSITHHMGSVYLPYRQAGVLKKQIEKYIEENKVNEAVWFIRDNFQVPSKESGNIGLWYSTLQSVCKAAAENDMVDCVFDLAEIVDVLFNEKFSGTKQVVDVHLIYLQFKLHNTLPMSMSLAKLHRFINVVKLHQGEKGILNLKQIMMEKGKLKLFLSALLSKRENQPLALKIIKEEGHKISEYVGAYHYPRYWNDLLSLDKLFRETTDVNVQFLNRLFYNQFIHILPYVAVTAECLSERILSKLMNDSNDNATQQILIHHLQFNNTKDEKIKLQRSLLKKIGERSNNKN